ncbi:hypothetical protein O0L34_g15607 [Tuta absoluta]|nr:hypothetical protein O0L34_g15607 [Tuta absoluta]
MTESVKSGDVSSATIRSAVDLEELLRPLQAQKEIDFGRVQSLFDQAKKIAGGDPAAGSAEFTYRLREIHDCRNSFQKAVTEINILNMRYKPEYRANYQEIKSFDDLYFYVLSVASEVCTEVVGVPKIEPPGSSKPNNSRCVRAHLPKLDIFHFDSKLENWQTFYDTFSSLIHNNEEISDIEKYYYLLSAVSGPALTLVKSMPITAVNYGIVWNLLVRKYENKRVLATSYLDKMFQFKPLQSESVAGLNSFFQTFQECVKALKMLKIPDLSSFLLFYVSMRNLDSGTRREFEQSVEQDEIPTFKELMVFVEKQVRVLEMSEIKSMSKLANFSKATGQFSTATGHISTANRVVFKSGGGSFSNSNKPQYVQKSALSACAVDKTNDTKINNQQKKPKSTCAFCGKLHSIYRCFQYADLSPPQRVAKVNELRLCHNCLRDSHTTESCDSKGRCVVCKALHHHTLHVDGAVSQEQDETASQNEKMVALACASNTTVMLGTAVVEVADAYGQFHQVRAAIDSGAMSGYITADCAQRLGLSRRKCEFESVGLGGQSVKNYGEVSSTIKPRNLSGPVLKADVVVVSQITVDLPTLAISPKVVSEFKDLELADPKYFVAAPVELLLAGDLFPYIYEGIKIFPKDPDLPIAMSSIFGYVIGGRTAVDDKHISQPTPPISCGLLAITGGSRIESIMSSFWETENVTHEKPRNPDDVYAEQLFQKDHFRDETGRYVVKYPFKPEFELGDSKAQAVRRLINLESKLERQQDVKKEYHAFLSEYESMGHMTCLGNLGEVESKYIVPHFCVLRPSSTSTKLRVVFDAASRTSNGNSLNSVVLAGPKLQVDINEILINFRVHKICLSSDIRKMFRMIMIDESQRKFQHILWRGSQDQPIKVYELNTVTYGVASSPYLSIRVLHQLADDEADKYPMGSKVLKKAFFVDDLLCSVATLDEATQLQDELLALLKAGGFDLRKWSSNCPELLARVPADYRETSLEFQDDKDFSVKVLGLQWMPAEDVFSFKTTPPSDKITKRTVLSQIGRQFDPLGFVAPCVFYAKCFMQKLWIQKLDWDDRLPPELEKEWATYAFELPLMSNFRLERQATISRHSYHQILGFSDASILGMAAVVYLRAFNPEGDVKVSLVIAKSKVAPLRTKSIPRLELQGALLLAHLVEYTKSILSEQIVIHDTFYFTDSAIVLAWLNTPTYTLQTYVATRVAKVLDLVSGENWFHVEGACNPADVCSRGALPSALLDMPEWLSGPQWLYTPEADWPIKSIDHFRGTSDLPELKNVVLLGATHTDENAKENVVFDLTERYSNFAKLQRVVARCFQFINNCRAERKKRNFSSPTLSDLNKAHDAIIKSVQEHHFSCEINSLSKGTKCSLHLRKLNAFLDSHGFLRAGGRLTQSRFPYHKKHPLVLPKKGNFTKMLIGHYHVIWLHVGPRSLQAMLCQKYWIISARSAILSVTTKCVACFRVRPSTLEPSMGSLPKYRSEDIHVFHTIGVDIGGPYFTKETNRRNARISKAYLCVFVCFATRAVHLEVLSSLSAECFLAAFDRFSYRRGLCHSVVSDNGTNFIAAGRQLSEVVQFFVQNNDQLASEFANRSVNWRYNPPTGSHFGGMYESAIKSAKLLLKRVIKDKALSFEELSTLFIRAEAVLNSRPLCSLSSDPSEFSALTPGHFLIGRELLSVPEYELSDRPAHALTRWQFVQQASQQFWKLWRTEYMLTLQQRSKWLSSSRNLQIGELVLIHSDAPPLQWRLGHVSQVHPGPDGVVRVVTVRTRNGELTRPVVKLSPLPISADEDVCLK